jgi:hypothetical protein
MTTVLLTATVHPHPDVYLLAVTDPAQRLADYERSCRAWRARCAERGWRLVLLENSVALTAADEAALRTAAGELRHLPDPDPHP